MGFEEYLPRKFSTPANILSCPPEKLNQATQACKKLEDTLASQISNKDSEEVSRARRTWWKAGDRSGTTRESCDVLRRERRAPRPAHQQGVNIDRRLVSECHGSPIWACS